MPIKFVKGGGGGGGARASSLYINLLPPQIARAGKAQVKGRAKVNNNNNYGQAMSVFQSQGHVNLLLAYICLDNSTLNVFFLCQVIVALHQGQVHWTEHEHVCHAYVYRYVKFECHSLITIIRDIINKLNVKKLSSLSRNCDLK